MLDIKGPVKCNYNEMMISWCFSQWDCHPPSPSAWSNTYLWVFELTWEIPRRIADSSWDAMQIVAVPMEDICMMVGLVVSVMLSWWLLCRELQDKMVLLNQQCWIRWLKMPGKQTVGAGGSQEGWDAQIPMQDSSQLSWGQALGSAGNFHGSSWAFGASLMPTLHPSAAGRTELLPWRGKAEGCPKGCEGTALIFPLQHQELPFRAQRFGGDALSWVFVGSCYPQGTVWVSLHHCLQNLWFIWF